MLYDLEHASHNEFQTFAESVGAVIDDKGIVEWSFTDRCRFINYALQRGYKPKLIAPLPNCLVNYSELFDVIEAELPSASEGK